MTIIMQTVIPNICKHSLSKPEWYKQNSWDYIILKTDFYIMKTYFMPLIIDRKIDTPRD